MAHADVRKRIPIVIVLLLVAGGLIWWFLRPQAFRYAGTVEATEVDVSPGVAAQITAYEVREGDAVQAGQVLVKLDGPDLRLNARLAEADYQRGAQLLRDGSITPAVFDRLKTQRDLTAQQVSWLTITAPCAGVILNKYHEPGEWARPGVNLLTLGDLSEVWAYVYVEQPMLARLSLGRQVAGILPEMPGRRFPGKIVLIRDQAEFTPKNVQTRDERTRLVYGVKLVFPNPDKVLKPGMTVEVELPERLAP
jgi:HlyD family secretion protein